MFTDNPFERDPSQDQIAQAINLGWQDVCHMLGLVGSDALMAASNLPGNDINSRIMNEVLTHLMSIGHSEEEARGFALGAAYMARVRSHYDRLADPQS